MLTRLARRLWKPGVAVALATTAVTGVALAASYTVVFGTSGPDILNEAGKTGNFHIYGFQGSDVITAGNGNITVDSHGVAHVNGYDYLTGDGRCSSTPAGNDSYCERPLPWKDQNWTDSDTSTDAIRGGVGPDFIVGGGGANLIQGSQTYDVITGGPHRNVITGGQLGSTILALKGSSASTITLLATNGVKGYDGLIGVPNAVDVHNGGNHDTVICASRANGDTVYADNGDAVINCAFVYRTAPQFPSATSAPQGATIRFPPGMSGGLTHRDTVVSHRHAGKHGKRARRR